MNSYKFSLVLAIIIYNVFLIPFAVLYGLHLISESIPISYSAYIGVFLVYGAIKNWFSFYLEFEKEE